MSGFVQKLNFFWMILFYSRNKKIINFGIVIDMRKHVTRTEKYKDYREEIKNSSLSFDKENAPKKESKTISQVLKETKVSLTAKNQTQNKHFYDKKEEKQLEKSVYDIYTSKRRWRRFFYFIFVVVLIAALIVLVLFLGNKYLGFNLW